MKYRSILHRHVCESNVLHVRQNMNIKVDAYDVNYFPLGNPTTTTQPTTQSTTPPTTVVTSSVPDSKFRHSGFIIRIYDEFEVHMY